MHITTLEALMQKAEGGNVNIVSELLRRCREDPTMTRELQSFVSDLPEEGGLTCRNGWPTFMRMQ